jgi:predicted RNA-binding Zn ribbon-like protein
MTFDSHVLNLVDVAARLVNHLTPGESGGVAVETPSGAARRRAVATALGGEGRRTPRVSDDQADALVAFAEALRDVFRRVARGDERGAVRLLNTLMRDAGARPQLDRLPDGDGWHVHFHGGDDSLATGWAAGCATGLALAIGSDLAGRLGGCAADRCDRVFVDTSRNATRRFCSVACQNRTKAAAFRARQQA